MIHISQRPLTVDEWTKRLDNAANLLEDLETNVAQLIVALDKAGDSSGLNENDRLNLIHATHGRLGNLSGLILLTRRRIERGLV